MKDAPIQIDRRREFRLPRIDELTKDQEDARALPMEGRHLVIGGPGTGKSVVALLRARRCAKSDKPFVFLVYNRLLNRASVLLAPELEKNFLTWESWFPCAFHEITGLECPKDPAAQGKTYKPINWVGVHRILETCEIKPSNKIVIVDEGQDMPPPFYQALVRLRFENFFVVADQNQQIVTGANSRLVDIKDELVIENEVELRENFRNTYPTARLAREFYTGDPATPPPVLPPPTQSSKIPLLCKYREEEFENLIRKILKFSDLDPARLIGIITPNNEVRKTYVKALRTTDVGLDHPRPVIQTYESGEDPGLRFDEGGIMVINQQSCKGLEFDYVFIADIHCFHFNPPDPDEAKRRFYVMVTRAKDRVVLLQRTGVDCPVDPIIPKDPKILERYAPQESNRTHG